MYIDDFLDDDESEDFLDLEDDEDNEDNEDNEEPEMPPRIALATKKNVAKQKPNFRTTTTSTIAWAFQEHEGFIPPGPGSPRGSASYRNNNPGNLKYMGQAGSTGADPKGFAIFGSYDAGWSALIRDINAKLARNPTHTILSLVVEYERGDPANPPGNDLAYAKDVAKHISEVVGKRITINTKINAI
jgi:hypothetical protein